MRRYPKQARSKAKVAAIVQAAMAQFQEVGYEGLSTADVAQRANVSVGTLYQFFDNKDDLLQAIAEEHTAVMRQFHQEYFGPDLIYVPPDILIGRTVDWLVEHNRQYPTFHQIFSSTWSDANMISQMDAVMADIIADLTKVLKHHAPTLPEDEAQVGATVLVSITKGMFNILELSDPTIQPNIIAGIKRMAHLYFNDLIAR